VLLGAPVLRQPAAACSGHWAVILVVMGVSGAGKSTLGAALASRLGWPFLEADDFHPPANVAKMRRGTPLDDADRAPWLARVHQALAAIDRRGGDAVLACSALKARHRALLGAGLRAIRFVHLHGPDAVLNRRLRQRRQHFMPAALLDSQLATLEVPDDALLVDIQQPTEAQVAAVIAALGLDGG
jgi:carbohydrate kinase (thermoresistant glucokinase family)